jgi:hypothetical protein
MTKRKPKFAPGMTMPGKQYRVVTFTVAFRVEEPAPWVDLELWQAQLCEVLTAAAHREEIPDEEFIIGYDPKR